MEKGVVKTERYLAIGVVVFSLCACSGVNASLLYVQDVQISAPGSFYTYSAGSGTVGFSARSCSVPTLIWDDSSSDYQITGAKLTINAPLVTDTSSGNVASGLFQGGRTLTLTGTFKYKPSGATILPANSTLLVANMDITSSETWQLAELPGVTINGSVYFHPDTTVGLGQGVDYNGTTLKIGAFRLDFTFQGLSPNPDNFVTGNISGTGNVVALVSAPEPAALLLFTIAALAFRIKNK